MRIIVIQFIVVLLSGCVGKPYSTSYNLDFEYAEQNSDPTRWGIVDENYHGYRTRLDISQGQHGKSSLCLKQVDSTKSGWALFYQELPSDLVAGKEIELRGWIKTQNVRDGFADFYIVQNEKLNYDTLSFDCFDRGVRNTTEWMRIQIRKRIDEHTSGVEIGGILKGGGTAWFDNLELTIDGRKVEDTTIAPPKTQLTRKDKMELRRYIYPLHATAPSDVDTADLKILARLVAGSKVVALGENSHGSHEIFRMKDRLIRHLAQNHNFNIFSIEAYMPESYRFNEYIQQGRGDAKSTVLQQGFWIWRTQEIVDMVSWMHDFNNSGYNKITYTGLDMQSYEGSIDMLKKAFQHHKPAMNCIDKLESGFAGVLTYSSIGNPQIAPSIAKELVAYLAQLKIFNDKSTVNSSDKAWVLQNITLLQQYLGQGADKWRDRCMADNLLWIKRQNPVSRILIWAHNGHVEKCRGKMGDILADSLGPDYVTFGFTFFDGKYTAIRPGSSQYIHEAQPAFPGTLEFLLEQLNEPMFILDLKKAKTENSSILSWIDNLRFRHIGAVKIENEFTGKSISDAFDYLIFIRESTPSKIL